MNIGDKVKLVDGMALYKPRIVNPTVRHFLETQVCTVKEIKGDHFRIQECGHIDKPTAFIPKSAVRVIDEYGRLL